MQYLLEQIVPRSIHSEKIGKVQRMLNDKDTTMLCDGESEHRCDHMTRGRFDEKLQIDLLMEYDERICGLLKNMTLAMDGKWVGMDEYC